MTIDFPINRALPEQGRDRAEILSELRTMAAEEDQSWQTGKVSGSYYCGDVEHYGFMTEAFGLFAHVNALQRDVCPSATRFEGEVIAMTLDMLGGASITDTTPGGILTSGGTGSILHALLAYRDHAREQRGITQPNVVKPETGHPAFDKACHLFGIEMRRAPVDPRTATADVAGVAELVDDNTIAIIGSACNYGYGTVDPIAELGQVAMAAGTGLHVDGCLGGFILPWGRELGLRHRGLRLLGAGRNEHECRHPQVRLRVQGHLGGVVPRHRGAEFAVLLPDRLDRW